MIILVNRIDSDSLQWRQGGECGTQQRGHDRAQGWAALNPDFHRLPDSEFHVRISLINKMLLKFKIKFMFIKFFNTLELRGTPRPSS